MSRLGLLVLVLAISSLASGCAVTEPPIAAPAAPRTSAPPAAQGDAAVAAPPAQPQARPAGEQREPKSRLVKSLLEALKGMNAEGTAEDRDLIEDMLRNSDEELDRALGDNSLKRITAANKKRPAFQVYSKQRDKGAKPGGGQSTPPAVTPPATATPTPTPTPMPMPAPAKPPVDDDDPFGTK